MLVLDFLVNSRLKNSQWHFCGIHEMSYHGCVEEGQKKNMILSVHQGYRDDQIATCAKLLNIKYKFYGFSGNLIETIN